MMKETPDADDDLDVTSSAPTHTKKPHPTKKPQPAKKPYPTMKPHPTVMKKKPDSTTMPKLTKKPHPTMKAEQEKKSHKTMPSKPTKKIHPTMMSKPSKNPHPTKQSGAQTPTPSTKGCASFQRGGGGGFTMFDVDLLESHGTFKISWQMDTIPDMIEIFYEDKKIFTTKVPVSGHGSAYAKYSGKSTKIRVWVTSPTSGTGWFLMIGCANDKH